MREISINPETYSDVDISKCGTYKYAEPDSFEILLFGVSVDGEPVRVYDLANGDTVPDDILAALSNENITKWAFNAAFERICLSNWLKRHYPEHFYGYSIPEDPASKYPAPSSWKVGIYGTSAVIGECKLRAEAPESEVQGRQGPDPVFLCSLQTDKNKRRQDTQLSGSGILIDIDVVNEAITMDERSKQKLSDRMKALTNIDNPASVPQMKQWLSENGLEMELLDKKTVAELLKTTPPEPKDVLILRRQLAKSSIKRYRAMQNAVCLDGRAHGMFQFY